MGKDKEKLLAVVAQWGVSGREGWPEVSVIGVLLIRGLTPQVVKVVK